MTEKDFQRYTEIKERFRLLGIENPAEVILALDKELELYKGRNDNVCVACGVIIPEGLQTCPNCLNGSQIRRTLNENLPQRR